MTRISKKLIAFIAGGVFILAAIVFLLWGSEGGKQWNTAKWFNYWGKGAPITATASEDQEAVYVRAVSNTGVVYDSDLSASVTATVEAYDRPQYEKQQDGIYLYCNGKHGRQLRMDIRKWSPYGDQNVFDTKIFEDGRPTSAYSSFLFSWEALRDELNNVGGFYDFMLYNVGDNCYDGNTYKTNMVPTVFTLYVPSTDDCDYIQPEINGTVVRYPYSSVRISGNPVHDQMFCISVAAGDTNDGTAPRDLWNMTMVLPSACDEYREFDKDNNEDSPFTDHKPTDEPGYLEIDLAQLGFVDRLFPVCSITATLKTVTGGGIYNLETAGYVQTFYFSISQLASPTNVAYSDGVLSWNAVEGAQGYALFDSNSLFSTTEQTSINVFSYLDVGEHILRVRALGNVGATLAADGVSMARMTAYNASRNITQLVALTFSANGDSMTKLVPYGSTFKEYLYDVSIPGKEFGGWFYDDGYSVAVNASDKLDKDTTIYARLSDKKVTERKLTWWDKYRWWVIGGAIALGVAVVVIGAVLGVRKDKKA